MKIVIDSKDQLSLGQCLKSNCLTLVFVKDGTYGLAVKFTLEKVYLLYLKRL